MVKAVSIVFVVACIALVCDKEEQTRQRKLGRLVPIFVLWLALALIATFRPPTMADYENYLRMFEQGYSTSGRIEGGYIFINNLFRDISDNFLWLLFFMALISIALKLYSIKKMSPLIWASIAIYISHFFILHDMIQVRAAVASGCALFAIRYKVEGNLKAFIITVCLSFLIHYSTLLLILVWFINPTKYQRTFYIWMIPVAYAVAITGNYISKFLLLVPIESVQFLMDMYTKGIFEESVNIFNLRQLLECTICFILWFNCKRIAPHNPYFIICLKVYTIGLSIIPLFADMSGAFRMSELYNIVEILLIPCIIFAVPRKAKFVGQLAVIAVASIFLLVNIYAGEGLLQ